MKDDRPNPDELLTSVLAEERRQKRGRLRLFFGMAAGVGKTYAMLREAQEEQKKGIEVWIGIVETHERSETQELMEGLPLIPRKKIHYRGTIQEEMDLDAILTKKPGLVLVDELAHSNIPGSRHEKRYQDVIEILDAGIDVYSTMNVQHLESRADVVGLITAVTIRETVPDSVMDLVEQIDIIDIAPNELIERLKEGKVYPGRMTEHALQYFFQEGNLSALREIALRVTAEKVEHDMRSPHGTTVKTADTTEKLLVAVSHSPYSEKLIRTARRIVEDLGIPWVAAHVETDKVLEPEDQNQLVKNLDLAKEMGAQLVTLNGADIADTITDYVRDHKIVQIIIGRPAHREKWWAFKRSTRFISKLIKANPQVDIMVSQHSQTETSVKTRRRRFAFEAHLKNYIVALIWVLAISFANYFLVPLIEYRAVGFLFLLLIIVLGVLSPLGSVLFAATLSALIWNFFFIPPQGTFTIHAPEDIMMFFTYFVIALSSGFLTFQIKRHQTILKDREQKTRALYEILKSMTLVRETKELVELALSKIENLFNAECCVLLSDNDKLTNRADFGDLELGKNDRAVAVWSYDHGRMAGWTTDTLPLSRVFCIALKSGEERLGALVFKPRVNKRLNPDQKDLLISIANQIGVALAKQKQEDTIQKGHLIKKSEELHRTLLNCISHELRTPLAAIMGAATALQSQMKDEVKQNSALKMLTEEIVGSSERLNHVFENLLDVTRLEAGAMPLNREWFDLSELTQYILNRQGKLLSRHKIKLDFPKDAVYFFGDFHLLEHAFSNLLLNAANYSPEQSTITVSAKIRAEAIVVEVSDLGPGIPPLLIPRLFEKFYRLPGTPAGGLGLGLSVTKNLIELHDGDIHVGNNPEGGATFSVIFPYFEMPQRIRESLV